MITVSCIVEDGKCAISVMDDGPGIPEGDSEKIFDKFYRASGSVAGGTGLGLTIAKGFVEAHHGTIIARNRSGSGAEFTLRLPMDYLPGTNGSMKMPASRSDHSRKDGWERPE